MQIVQPKEAHKGQRRCIRACEDALKWPWMSLDIPLTLKWQWMTKAQCEMNRAEDDKMNARRQLQRPENDYTWPKSGYEGDEWLQRWPKNHQHASCRGTWASWRVSHKLYKWTTHLYLDHANLNAQIDSMICHVTAINAMPLSEINLLCKSRWDVLMNSIVKGVKCNFLLK